MVPVCGYSSHISPVFFGSGNGVWGGERHHGFFEKKKQTKLDIVVNSCLPVYHSRAFIAYVPRLKNPQAVKLYPRRDSSVNVWFDSRSPKSCISSVMATALIQYDHPIVSRQFFENTKPIVHRLWIVVSLAVFNSNSRRRFASAKKR